MDCAAREDQLRLFALDALDAQEHKALRAHLQGGCPRCAGKLAEARAMLAMLPMTLAPVAPPADARRKLMDRVTTTIPAQSPLPAGSMKRANADGRARHVWMTPAVIGAGVAASLTVLIYANILAKERKLLDTIDKRVTQKEDEVKELEGRLGFAEKMNRMIGSSSVQVVTLKGMETQPKAMGRLIWEPTQKDLHFYAHGLKTLRPGMAYELWLIAPGRKPFPAATFKVDAEGQGEVARVLTDDVGAVQVSAVTEEKAEGSKDPTMPMVLSGKVE